MLLRRHDLGLTLISKLADVPAEKLDRPLRWVHSSDLSDPTPFLLADLALLTTGTQFDDPARIGAYVERLNRHGVLGLGFGAGVHRESVPAELIAACAKHGLPLFDVPYGTPFIAVTRAHSEAVAAHHYARRTWALEAHRAVTGAALGQRGLAATIGELSRRLHSWAGIFDPSGALRLEHPQNSVDRNDLTDLSGHVSHLLTRGLESSQSTAIGGQDFLLFTIGHSGHLRGVFSIARESLDPEERMLVISVIAMAGLALNQNEEHRRKRRSLHTQLLNSLMTDDPSLAKEVLSALPAEPILVAAAGQTADSFIDWWERRRTSCGAPAFVAESRDGIVVCVSADDEAFLDTAATQFGLRIGISQPHSYETFSRAHAQAHTALGEHNRTGAVRYGEIMGRSLFGEFATCGSVLLAQSRLAALREHDAHTGSELEESVRIWLENDARALPASERLGIHRHTLRARIEQAGILVGIDLSSFPGRAEFWALLHTSAGERR